MEKLPLLYSFRRCPYAMRARMALVAANINVELREVDLKAKPSELLMTSPKGTVPVLVLPSGTVLEESLDIMAYAAEQDPSWAFEKDHELIEANDHDFTKHLRRYKYFERYPEHPQSYYREAALQHIDTLSERLSQQDFLLGDKPSFVDIALFPFIRQFAKADEDWFEQTDYTQIKQWLSYWSTSPYFEKAMKKFPIWQKGDNQIFLFQ